MYMTDATRSVGLLVVVAILLLIGLPLLGGVLMMGGMMGPGMMGGWWAGNNLWWMLLPLLVWGLILVGLGLVAIWAIQQFAPSQARGQHALDILKERYARGELTREQYEQMRRDLEA
jgi:putative membrane protein